jgi:hypothetical protein
MAKKGVATESTDSVRNAVRNKSMTQGRTPNNYKEDWAKIGNKAPDDWSACGSKAK